MNVLTNYKYALFMFIVVVVCKRIMCIIYREV